MQQVEAEQMALVVVGYDTQYPDPLAIDAGGRLKVVKLRDGEWPGWVFCEDDQTGRKGWIPEKIVTIQGDEAVAQQTYTAREVSVMQGEIVRIEKTESGWAWVTNMTNESGWVPLKNLKIVE